MLEIQRSMWAGQIDEIVAKKHLVEIEPGRVPENQMTSRQELEVLDETFKDIRKQLDVDLIEPFMS